MKIPRAVHQFHWKNIKNSTKRRPSIELLTEKNIKLNANQLPFFHSDFFLRISNRLWFPSSNDFMRSRKKSICKYGKLRNQRTFFLNCQEKLYYNSIVSDFCPVSEENQAIIERKKRYIDSLCCRKIRLVELWESVFFFGRIFCGIEMTPCVIDSQLMKTLHWRVGKEYL